MSLINDALRRASQTERNRPQRAPTPMRMEPTPAVVRGSRVSLLLVAIVALALLLACWFFWQWWMVRHDLGAIHPVSNAPPPPMMHAPVAAAPQPVPVVPVAPVVQPKPALAPVVAAPPVVSPRVAAPPEIPVVSNYAPTPWPVDLKLNAIFFNKTNPRAMINGNMYGTGEDIQGVAVKSIEKDKVTLEWGGHTRVLNLEAQ